jgi:hypothetical protein
MTNNLLTPRGAVLLSFVFSFLAAAAPPSPVVVQQWNNNGTLYLMPDISDGTNFNLTDWTNTGQPYATGPGGTPGLLALDINGDGKTDLVQAIVYFRRGDCTDMEEP